MFFINKDKISEFQNRCVIALFLDYHTDVSFCEYVEKNHFRGYKNNSKLLQEFYIFNVPKFSKTEADSGIVYKYKGRKTNREFTYLDFNKGFILEYVKFRNNPYDYICNYFVSRKWEQNYEKLLVSDIDAMNKMSYSGAGLLVKYKSDPIGIPKGAYGMYLNDKDSVPDNVRYFMNALNGELAFTKPEWLNDPFDCDCEIPLKKTFPNIIRGAMQGTKYRKYAVSEIEENQLSKWWNELKDNEKDHIISVFSKIPESPGENIDNDAEYEEGKRIIINLYRNYKNQEIDENKAATIIERYCSMRNRIGNLKNEFRILSLAYNEKDILMWGYYGNSGQGICIRHKIDDICKGIKESKDAEKCSAHFCIYGEIDYEEQKPQFLPTSQTGVDGVLEYIVACVFTKNEKWKHEKEFRYVLMGKDVKTSGAICIQSKLEHRFMGVKYADVNFYKELDEKNAWPDENDNVDYLEKHTTKYELIY